MNFKICPWQVSKAFWKTRTLASQYIKLYLLLVYYKPLIPLIHLVNWTKLYQLKGVCGLKVRDTSTSRLITLDKPKTYFNKKISWPALRTKTSSKLSSSKFYSITLWWLQVTIPQANHWSSNNPKFRFFFSSSHSPKVSFSLVSIERYIWRVNDSLVFLNNLFYVDANYWMLGNELFLEEILVFNWEARLLTFKLFKFLNTYIYFKDLSHGSAIRRVLQVLSKVNLDFTLITDIRTHYKTQKYLHKLNIFTIGLIPTNYSPWSVSYPIPAYSNSPKIQFLFIHLTFYVQSLTIIQKS